jgi:hypothetical protein
MKRLLLTSTLLFLIAISCYLLMVAGINRLYFRGTRVALCALPYLQRTGGQEHRMFSDNLGHDRPEVVVVGSSHAYRGYDPRVFADYGLDMINTGTSSQHSLASYLLTREYWDFDSKPIYIIDIYPQVFMEEGVECTTRLIQNVPDDYVAQKLVMTDLDIRSINAYFSRLFSDRSKIEFEAEDYLGKGYCSNPDTMKTALMAVDSSFEGRHIYFDYLHRLLFYIQSEGATAILVNQPMPLDSNYAKFNEAFNRELELVLNVSRAEHSAGTIHSERFPVPLYIDGLPNNSGGMIYYDMSQDADFDICCDFSDSRHLNQTGVEKFNLKLLKRLKDDGFIGGAASHQPISMTVHKTPTNME